MTANYGIEPPPSTNYSYAQAQEAAQADLKRLRHGHILDWTIDLECGAVVIRCSCNNPGPYNGAGAEKHVLAAVKNARGPTRGPKR